MRAGTENVYGVAGFARGLEIAMRDYEQVSNYINDLTHSMIGQLTKEIDRVSFSCPAGSSCTLLSACCPNREKAGLLLRNLDINNICRSAPSACSSGADAGPHVTEARQEADQSVPVRFS